MIPSFSETERVGLYVLRSSAPSALQHCILQRSEFLTVLRVA